MADLEANELARRNYAIHAETFGEEFYLQISCGDEILTTISAGPYQVEPTEFVVYNGTGLDENDEDDPSSIVRRFAIDNEPMDTWREASRYCYLHALSRMMVPDQRNARATFEAFL